MRSFILGVYFWRFTPSNSGSIEPENMCIRSTKYPHKIEEHCANKKKLELDLQCYTVISYFMWGSNTSIVTPILQLWPCRLLGSLSSLGWEGTQGQLYLTTQHPVPALPLQCHSWCVGTCSQGAESSGTSRKSLRLYSYISSLHRKCIGDQPPKI